MRGVGVFLGIDGWGEPAAWPTLLETAGRAAAAGLPVFVGEHRGRPEYAPSALALAVALAGSFPGIDVTTAGVVAGARDPVSVPRDAAVAAAATAWDNGQFRLGLVAGYDAADLPGSRHAKRYGALDELVHMLEASRPCPVLVGGGVDAAIRRAAKLDGWIAPTQVDAADIGRFAAQLRSAQPDAQVVAVRRWMAAETRSVLATMPQPAGSRTPIDQLVGGGPRIVSEQVGDLHANGADIVALGPITHPAMFDRLLADLTE